MLYLHVVGHSSPASKNETGANSRVVERNLPRKVPVYALFSTASEYPILALTLSLRALL